MKANEIKQAVNEGKTVCWNNPSYKVIHKNNDYFIKCDNGSCIGLTWADDVTLNGKEEDFFILTNS